MRAKLPTVADHDVSAIAVIAVAAAALVLLWQRTRPYDVDKAVAAMYVLLASLDIACAPSREYENRHWVCLPLVLDVTTQYVDIGNLARALTKTGATLVAEAVTDNPNGRNLVVRVPKTAVGGCQALWGGAAAAAVCAIYVWHYGPAW